MRSVRPHNTRKAGLSPGTLAERENIGTASSITVMSYNEAFLEERSITNLEELEQYRNADRVSWINIDGTEDSKSLSKIGEIFNLHALLLEDISIAGQRPKVDDFDEQLFTTLNMLSYDDEKNCISVEQISIVLGRNYVLSFQEAGGDVFDPNRFRIRTNKGKLRKSPSDYLFYTLIDTIVDNYFIILERIGEKLEDIEDALIIEPTEDILNELYSIKRELILLRKSIWPLREVLMKFEREEFEQISSTTQTYFKDVYDHTVQIIDTLESFRDLSGGMLDLYMSSISNKMNAVMKVLTVISTIFIPLSFLAGIYGMNFDFIPELKWKYGYFGFLATCLTILVAMLFYFKRKKWL
ncbi:magnesium/cobalt transporter CorA [Sporocytophaga myxococcoides]|uniref:magnesium/cobalt transporter CorA n=1 Tax=Sporocytophaga myxococcoides TaxID=153721 RepID=UPI00041BFC8B|nr:magnesium/cobalt transporter CorA [Sporocytophaga myxococcoides]